MKVPSHSTQLVQVADRATVPSAHKTAKKTPFKAQLFQVYVVLTIFFHNEILSAQSMLFIFQKFTSYW